MSTIRDLLTNILREPKNLLVLIITLFVFSGLALLLLLTQYAPAFALNEEIVLILFAGLLALLLRLYYSISQYNPPALSDPRLTITDVPLETTVSSIGQVLEEHRRIEEELRLREERLITTLNSMPHAVITTDQKELITFMNPMAEKLTGWKKQEAIRKPVGDVYRIQEDDQSNKVINPLAPMGKGSKKTKNHQYVLRSRSGSGVWVLSSVARMKSKMGESLGVVIAFQDLSEQKRQEMKMIEEAHLDDLTGLPNRRHLQKSFSGLVGGQRGKNQQLAVMFLDLDRFKSVNDTFGHEVGDLLLKLVSKRFRSLISKNDIVSRIAGDEFIIVLRDIDKPQALGVAHRILDGMKEPFFIRGYRLLVTPSIGISFFPEDGAKLDELLDKADQAMYQAKKSGKNNVQIFDHSRIS
ncbi:diguanylate cyclase domain-containing protein [Ammoniphilus sp. YIM 78166]|uniref:diguanylate cyclase domain-containing protein n=1 Tax=Ammoniphilus sp. YIM 78166 TaxID=1644106 RepID=UPI00106F5FD5|nr:diguanylate cyclase [Ammoniphilus sp. YIM 78166]